MLSVLDHQFAGDVLHLFDALGLRPFAEKSPALPNIVYGLQAAVESPLKYHSAGDGHVATSDVVVSGHEAYQSVAASISAAKKGFRVSPRKHSSAG